MTKVYQRFVHTTAFYDVYSTLPENVADDEPIDNYLANELSIGSAAVVQDDGLSRFRTFRLSGTHTTLLSSVK